MNLSLRYFIIGLVTAITVMFSAYLVSPYSLRRAQNEAMFNRQFSDPQIERMSGFAQQMQSDLGYTKITSMAARADFSKYLLNLDDPDKLKKHMCVSLMQFLGSRELWYSNDATARSAGAWEIQKIQIEEFIQSRPDLSAIISTIKTQQLKKEKDDPANKTTTDNLRGVAPAVSGS